jgi:hypothetical protein
MPKRFFELADDVNVPHRWHLAMPRDTQGLKVDDGQFRLGFPVLLKEREGWTGPLIVSEEIHDALERMGATGTRFEEV